MLTSGGSHACAAAVSGGNKQRRELLREFRKPNGGLGILSGADGFHPARALPVGGKGKDRGGALQIADGEGARLLAIDAQNARASRRHQKVRSCRRAYLPECRKNGIGHPIHRQDHRGIFCGDVMITGRPARNSARPRSTATCSGSPNRPAFTPNHVTPRIRLGGLILNGPPQD